MEEGDEVAQGQILARLDGQRLRLEMEQAKANLEMARREYERTINLHECGLVSAAAFSGSFKSRNALATESGKNHPIKAYARHPAMVKMIAASPA